jgi:hypothetical protein
MKNCHHRSGRLGKVTIVFWCLLLLLAGILNVGGFIISTLLLVAKALFLAMLVVFLVLVAWLVKDSFSKPRQSGTRSDPVTHPDKKVVDLDEGGV